MRKSGFFLLMLVACIWAMNAYSVDSTSGYVVSVYGHALKDAYNECVHTAYYDPEHDGRAECGTAKVVASAPAAKQIVIETVTMSDAGDVLFKFDIAALTPAGVNALTVFSKKLGSQPDITSVTIDGYTDAIGSSSYNLKLSANRADAVKQFFIKNGVSAKIITAHGYGEKNVRVSNACMTKYGNGDMGQIWQLEQKLDNKKYMSKNKQAVREKKQLQEKLHTLEAKRNKLIACAAPDRKVVFTIVHTKEVESSVVNQQGTESMPAVDMSKLAKPPVEEME